MLLDNQIAIVTGGSRGIGYAIVKKFLENGATVILCASRQDNARKAVDSLHSINPDWNVEGIAPNLSDYDDVKSQFDDIIKRYGRIDILVNNAGSSSSEPFTSYTTDSFNKIMDLNINAVFNCTRAVVEHMQANHRGNIINTSSMVSKYGQPAGVAYPTSKFALNGMTISLARELGPQGIRVNAVAPGITNTDMMQAVPKEVIEPLIKQIPFLKQYGF